MAGNPPIGNHFYDGPLGVVQLEFNSVDLGKTLDTTTIETIEDIFDIFYAQDGTQPYDKIPTGKAKLVTCQFAEVNNTLLSTLERGVTKSGDGNTLKISRDLYRSGRTNFAKTLTIKRVDSEGNVSTDPFFIMNYYLAFPVITGSHEFGPDNQRVLEVQFYIMYNEAKEAFGYSGYASSVGL